MGLGNLYYNNNTNKNRYTPYMCFISTKVNTNIFNRLLNIYIRKVDFKRLVIYTKPVTLMGNIK